ncbi:hypothetical protein CR983_02355 [Candidatus Saccharibacteria bacterium]|nr:MAG: hypothetical protein CR983_02355 [Candidatus Saccharibacteria bacterium]
MSERIADTTPETETNERLHVDLHTPEYGDKFANAKSFVKTAPVIVEEVTAEGLASGAYEDKGVVQNADGEYVLTTIVVNQSKGKDGEIVRTPEEEGNYVLEPGNYIVTNPVWRPGEPRNHFVQTDRAKIEKLYEPAAADDTLEGFSFGDDELPGVVMRPKGYSEGTIQPRKIVENDTGREVEIDAPWGGTQLGSFDCRFAENGGERYILSDNDFAGYVPEWQYQQR